MLLHVLRRHDINAGSGNVLQQHVADMDGCLRRHLLQGGYDRKNRPLGNILRRLAADDRGSGPAAGQADR